MTALWRDRYKLATAILATSLLVGLVVWSGIFQATSAWWNSYEVWYWSAEQTHAEQDGPFIVINVIGGWEVTDKRLFTCHIDEQFHRKAALAGFHGRLTLPTNRCKEILP